MENFDEIMPQILEATNIQSDDILLIRNVKKVNKHGKINKRILLITATQIFLIEKRSFHRGLKISNPFQVSDLTSIEIINKNQIDAKFKDRHMVISDSTIPELFDPLSAYYHPILTPEEFSATHLPQTTNSNLPSNSNALYERLKHKLLSENKLNNLPPITFRDTLTELSKKDTLDFSILESYQNIIDELLYTFQILPNLKKMIIKKVNISWSTLADFISKNTTLAYLETHQEITKEFPQFCQAYSANPNLPLTNLSFNDSKFGADMVEGLKIMLEPHRLTNLTIKNGLTVFGYKQLFPLLLNSQGFQTVTYFDLSGCKTVVPECIIVQLENLTTLKLNNCSLDLSILLTDLNRTRNIPLTDIFVCENFCSENLDPSFVLSKNLKSFHADNVVWSGSSLQSFITIVSQTNDRPAIDLSLQGIQLNDWQDFDTFLQQTSNKNIVSLDYSYNPIYSGFCTFLNNSRKLTNLTLTGCFSQTSTGIQIFAKYLGSNTYLKELRVIGSLQSYLGESIIYLLKAVATNPNISTLDISYNLVGNKLLSMIVDLLSANPNIKNIYLDHNNISDPTQFRCFIDTLIKMYCTTYIHYPQFDLKQMVDRGIMTQDQVDTLVEKWQTSTSNALSMPAAPRCTYSDKRSMNKIKENPLNQSTKSMSHKLYNHRQSGLLPAKKTNSSHFYQEDVDRGAAEKQLIETNLPLTAMSYSSNHLIPSKPSMKERRPSDLLSDLVDTSGLIPPEELDEIQQVTDTYIFDLEWMSFLNDIPVLNMDPINKNLETQTSFEVLTKALYPNAQK